MTNPQSIAPQTGTGSSSDILSRVKRLLPTGWFSSTASVRDAVVGALSDAASWCYALTGYAKAQQRLATAYGIWLDILCYDFLGPYLTRGALNDDAFRALIKATILQERVTRAGMIAAVTAITSKTPKLFEPWNTGDTGAYSASQKTSAAPKSYTLVGIVTGTDAGAANVVQLILGDGDVASVAGYASGDTVTVANVGGTTEANGTWVIDVVISGAIGRINLRGTTFVHAWTSGGTISDVVNQLTPSIAPHSTSQQYGSFGYGVGTGGYGNMNLPGQAFMILHRGVPGGVPTVGGYGSPNAGYSAGQREYVGPSIQQVDIPDSVILDVVNKTKPTGTTMWVAFQ